VNILLIGHEGYIGRGLHACLGRAHNVIGWDKEQDLFALAPSTLQDHGIDVVINLSVAADRAQGRFQIDTPTDRVNVEGARHLAQVLRGTDVHWFQMSTREVLGPIYRKDDVITTDDGYRPRFLVDESRPYAPTNSYGKSKVIAELISESHPRSTVIRLTTGYTDYSHPVAGNWVVALMRAVTAGKPVTLTQGGLQFRDPLHTDDLGALIESIVESGSTGEVFHAGGGSDLISLREFVSLADPDVDIREADGGDYGFAFDISKAKRMTGWEPRVSVRERIPLIRENIRNEVFGPSTRDGRPAPSRP
jgi:nucleoside-diphosphate-sugar epimerase